MTRNELLIAIQQVVWNGPKDSTSWFTTDKIMDLIDQWDSGGNHALAHTNHQTHAQTTKGHERVDL